MSGERSRDQEIEGESKFLEVEGVDSAAEINRKLEAVAATGFTPAQYSS